jgi:hypothetical protein
LAVCCLMLILSAGCAALSPVTTKQETLDERVNHYMQARLDGKWSHVYTFFDSSSRETLSRESFMNRTRKMSFTGFTIAETTMLPSGDQATVKVKIDISHMGFEFKGVSEMQNWVKERGEWFVKSNITEPKKQK